VKKLTVYYKPSCPFSVATVAFLILRGADFSLVNLALHPVEEERVLVALKGRTLETPTIQADGELLVAPSLSRLGDKLESLGLPEAASPHAQIDEYR
jgi:glutaredoxin